MGYHLELSLPDTMNFLSSIKSKITENENSENVSH